MYKTEKQLDYLMGSPEMDWRRAICWALMDSKTAMRLGMTQLRYSSSLGWEWEGFDFGSGTPPMDGAGGGRGVVVERRREEEASGRNLCYLLGVQTPSLTTAATLRSSQLEGQSNPGFGSFLVPFEVRFRVFIFFYLIFVLIPLCIHKNSLDFTTFF